MDNLFTRDDIDLAIAGCHTFLNSGLLEQPEIIRGYRESVDLTGETKKTLNLLENVLHWMKKAEAAPQAQEEPSGAPAPVSRWSKDNPCPWCKSCGIPAEHHKEGWYVTGSDGKPCTEFVPWEYPEPQPPAPASPAWLVWTKEKPTRDGWYWLRLPGATAQCEFIVRDHENGVSRWINELSGEWEPVLDGREWAGPIPEPAAPEAGAPGTQGTT